MARHVTTAGLPTLEIEGTAYLTMSEVARQAGVTRQTIWRWRRERKIPPGWRFRDHVILYGVDEAKVILEFANRLEPIDIGDDQQASLFEEDSSGKR